MHQAASLPDVNGGFYTVSEAARLLGIESTRRITRWLLPPKSGGEPIIMRDYPKVGREHEVSFLDLMEVRFVEHFRRTKISLQALRIAAQNARAELGVSHPFATSNVKFQSDRKRVFLETARATGDRELLDLMTKQVAIYDVIEQSLERDLEFDVEGFARLWRPSPAVAPNVVVAPSYAFGRPIISRRRLPTATLFQAWKANNNDAVLVSEWFEVDKEEVNEAVRFELRPLH